MNTRVKSVLTLLSVCLLYQEVICLPSPPQSQQFPLKRFDEAQDPLAYEKDFNQEQMISQNELPQQTVETGYWPRNENQQIRLMPESEKDGTGPGEVISQKNNQGIIDQASQIPRLTTQSNQQRGNGLSESTSQINQGSLSKDWGISEEIIDGYKENTSRVKSKDEWENSNFPQDDTNFDPQRRDASGITNQNNWLKGDRSNSVKGKRDRSNSVKGKKTEREALTYIPHRTSSRNADRDKRDYDTKKTNKTNDVSEAVEVQERGLKKWALKKKKSRKGKTMLVTKIRRNKFWKKSNRKGNMVVRRKSLSAGQKWNEKYSKVNKKVFKKSKKNYDTKFDREQNKSEKNVQEYGKDNGKSDSPISANDPESKSSQLDGREKWDSGAMDSRKTKDLDDIPVIQDHKEVLKKGDDKGRTDGKKENNPTENESRRDDWKEWDRGEIYSRKTEEVPNIQDSREKAWKKWDEEKTEGNRETSPTDDDSQRKDWEKWDRGTIGVNSGKTERGSALQDNRGEAWKKWDEDNTYGNIENSPTDDDSQRKDWEKWDRGTIGVNSGKTERGSALQDNRGEAWKKWDEENTYGNIENSPTDDDSQRKDWEKWDRDTIGANSEKTERGSALRDNREEAWKKWDEEKTEGNRETSPTDDDSQRKDWEKWDRGTIGVNSGKTERGSALQDNRGEAWKKWDEENTYGNIENSPTDDDSQRKDWEKWDRATIGANSEKN